MNMERTSFLARWFDREGYAYDKIHNSNRIELNCSIAWNACCWSHNKIVKSPYFKTIKCFAFDTIRVFPAKQINSFRVDSVFLENVSINFGNDNTSRSQERLLIKLKWVVFSKNSKVCISFTFIGLTLNLYIVFSTFNCQY